MRRSIRAALSVGAVAILLSAAACSGSSSTGSTSAAGTSAAGGSAAEGSASGGASGAAAPSGDPLVIGLLVPLAGAVAQTGEQISNVVQMRVDEINADGGVLGRPLEIKTYDTKFQPETAAQQAQRAAQDEVSAVIGPYSTSEALAVAEVVERMKLVDINYSAATPAITEGKSFVFRVAPLTTDLALGMMQLGEALGSTNGVLLYDSGGFGLGAKDPIEAAAKEGGITLTDSIQYPANASDVSAQVAAAAQGNPKAVYVAGSAGADHGLIAKAMAEQGLLVPLIGFSPIVNSDAVKIAGDAYTQLPGVYTLNTVDTTKPTYQSTLSDYNSKFTQVGNLPEQPLQSGDAIDFIVAGLEKTNGEGGEALAQALQTLPARQGVAGKTGSDQQFLADDHNAFKGNYLVPYKIVDGQPVQDTAVTLG